MTFSKDEIPPMVPSADERARDAFGDAVAEAPSDVFADPDGNWTYHISIIVGEAIEQAYRDGYAANTRAERILEALREPSDELVDAPSPALVEAVIQAARQCCETLRRVGDPREVYLGDLQRALARYDAEQVLTGGQNDPDSLRLSPL